MNYKDYQFARDAAWKILIRERVCALPVSMSRLCRQMGIEVKYDDKVRLDDGCGGMVLKKGRRYVIIVRRSDPPQRQRFTIAHELGHILAGDVGRYKLVNREPSPRDNPIETRANVIASRILAPACVLWGCGVCSAQDIARICDISYAAASFRWQRMQLLYARGKFLASPLERQVFEQFRDYIQEHKL